MTQPLTPQLGTRNSAGRTAAGLTLLIGLWYIISPWVLGAYNASPANVWNNVVVGILIAVFAAARMNDRVGVAWPAWLDAILGAWAFFSPWIYGYTPDTARFVNSLCCGAAVFLLSVAAGGVRRPLARV